MSTKPKPGNPFDDMADDLPWKAEDDPIMQMVEKRGYVVKPERDPLQLEADLRGDLGFLEFERRRQLNKKKNANRKYKPQKGRMKLLICDNGNCGWKVRAAQSTIDRAKGAPCPACIRELKSEPGRLIQGD